MPSLRCAGEGGANGEAAGEEMQLEHTDEASAAAAAKLRQQQRAETIRCALGRSCGAAAAAPEGPGLMTSASSCHMRILAKQGHQGLNSCIKHAVAVLAVP